MAINSLAVMSPEGGLSRYLTEIRKFPMLAKDEEFMLAKRWREHEDPEAAHRLVTSHLRLVAKIAMGYRGYGLPIGEVISEGNVGLMQAVKKFEPDKGFRLATYAMWWIRASIQEYILRSWSLVKMGTTAAQKKLFFNLRKAKSEISALEEGDLHPEQVQPDRHQAGRARRGSDLDEPAPVRPGRLAERAAARRLARTSGRTGWPTTRRRQPGDPCWPRARSKSIRMGLLEEAMTELTDRERHILTERRLKDDPTTLEDLAAEYGVSRERVRQIEVRAFEKLQKAMRAAAERTEPGRRVRPMDLPPLGETGGEAAGGGRAAIARANPESRAGRRRTPLRRADARRLPPEGGGQRGAASRRGERRPATPQSRPRQAEADDHQHPDRRFGNAAHVGLEGQGVAGDLCVVHDAAVVQKQVAAGIARIRTQKRAASGALGHVDDKSLAGRQRDVRRRGVDERAPRGQVDGLGKGIGAGIEASPQIDLNQIAGAGSIERYPRQLAADPGGHLLLPLHRVVEAGPAAGRVALIEHAGGVGAGGQDRGRGGREQRTDTRHETPQ